VDATTSKIETKNHLNINQETRTSVGTFR